MGTSTLGLSFATMTPLIWQYARAFFNDVSPILIWVVGAVIAFFVATKLIDILSGGSSTKLPESVYMTPRQIQEADFLEATELETDPEAQIYDDDDDDDEE
jgi:flagellar biosynthesis/type III secretory pathway M-ring protein FliF/YscJ